MAKIFLFINTSGEGSALAYALAEDGTMLRESLAMNEYAALNALLFETKQYWDKYPRGFTLEMIPIGAKPEANAELQEAVRLHYKLPSKLLTKRDDGIGHVIEGGG